MPEGVPYRGLLYRAITPRYAAEPLSGEGARRFGGRFNAKGTEALYLALDFVTAMNEANQVGNLQPTTLVCYQAEIEALFDARDTQALGRAGIDAGRLFSGSWRDEMRTEGRAYSQSVAADLARNGFSGLIYRSLAPGNLTRPEAFCLVLWTWPEPPAALRVIDEENRLVALRQITSGG